MVNISFIETGIFGVYTPTQIYFGYGAVEPGLKEARNFGKKALIVIGKGSVKRLGYLERVEDLLEKEGVSFKVIEGISENPTEEEVEEKVKEVEEFEPDFFIALGGGSVIDATKAINVVYSNGISIKEAYKGGFKKVLPIVAIPTTSGTGSEVTRYSVITDTSARVKKVIADYMICPRLAIVDPEFTLKLPRSVTISSGLDAISHSLEALLGYYSNPLIDTIALKGVELGVNFIIPAVEEGSKESRFNMMLSSLLGGIAINAVPTGLAHAMSYSITSNFGIPHGIAVAMVFPEVMKLMDYKEKIELLRKILGEDPISFFEELNERLSVPKKIEGLTEELCEKFARGVVENRAKLRNNIKIPSFEEVKAIYMKFLP